MNEKRNVERSSKIEKVRQYSFLIDGVHKNQERWHVLKLMIVVLMVNVIPVIIKKTKKRGQKT
jgi:hypothetical protein